ncbi:dynein light chain [Trypanosoma rangeli]|uniref:Dynein light chain n=1 Tax=Trypanosoma rangeli TaxID=5698 RepID=A0A422NIV0_TRYRA|nr:dynein light chain [Trypanosoma rangeli]RNF05418.1 dynein light chain [Trypanosoma rangeli]|eukprot:RNF05418.1 dynein light chain [Trypanosoma rangeli]
MNDAEPDHVVEDEVKERPVRVIKVQRYDGTKTFLNSVIELAQVVLDNMPPDACYKDIAIGLKKKLEEVEKGTWHVIVGTHFGANVTNDAETLVNVKIDEMHFLVFRSGPPERPVVLTDGQ